MKVSRLLRFYPRQWRDRYGDELAQLVADVEEGGYRRRMRIRVDVARQGLALRLDGTGLRARPAPSDEHRRWGLVSALVGGVTFLLGTLMVFRYMRRWESYGYIVTRTRIREPLAGAPVILHTMAVWGDATLGLLLAAALAPFAIGCARALKAAPRGPVVAPVIGLVVGVGLGVAGYVAHRTEWEHWKSGWGSLPALSIQVGRTRWGLSFGRFGQYAFTVLTAAAIVLVVLNTAKLVRRLHVGTRSWRFEAVVVRAATWWCAATVVVTAAWLVSIAVIEPTFYGGSIGARSVHEVRDGAGVVVQRVFWAQTGVAGTWLWPTLVVAGAVILGSFTLVRRGTERVAATIETAIAEVA